MNLVLVEESELSDGLCVLADRRAAHLREVLGVAVGATIKMGVLGGAIGTGEVVRDDSSGVALRFTRTEDARPQLELELVLAMPRPKVLARVIEACAAFAIRRIDLTNAWRVDKSYLRSPKLLAESLSASARLGAEQGATTHVPEIVMHERLMELLDGRFGKAGSGRLIAHPGAKPIEGVAGAGPKVIAIGPEGGWIDRELDTFMDRGFAACSLGSAIMRVESAISVAIGQVMLLDRIAER